MNKCELCKNTARVYCESDEARLCWSCDAKVHAANFLVARHVRNLLCHSCQSPTPWNGSGEKLGRTISLCEPCVVTECVKSTEREGSFESGTDYDSDQNQSYNQVASSKSPLPPPPLVSSSSSEDRSQIDINVSLKRSRDFLLDLNSKNDFDSSCIAGEGNSYVERSSSVRPFKFQKLKLNESAGRPQGTLTASRIAEPPRRIRHRVDMNEPFSGVEARECVDFDLNECPFEQHK